MAEGNPGIRERRTELDPRAIEILKFKALGFTEEEICSKMFFSVTHLRTILHNGGVFLDQFETTIQAVLGSIAAGHIDPVEIASSVDYAQLETLTPRELETLRATVFSEWDNCTH